MDASHVAPPPVAQLNDEQGAAEVEQALAARRNRRVNLAQLANKGKHKRRDDEDNSSDSDSETEQPQEPVLPVKVQGPVKSLTQSPVEGKHTLYRFMYLFENILTSQAGGHGLDFGSLTRR
jgi:hypothetical protein